MTWARQPDRLPDRHWRPQWRSRSPLPQGSGFEQAPGQAFTPARAGAHSPAHAAQRRVLAGRSSGYSRLGRPLRRMWPTGPQVTFEFGPLSADCQCHSSRSGPRSGPGARNGCFGPAAVPVARVGTSRSSSNPCTQLSQCVCDSVRKSRSPARHGQDAAFPSHFVMEPSTKFRFESAAAVRLSKPLCPLGPARGRRPI